MEYLELNTTYKNGKFEPEIKITRLDKSTTSFKYRDKHVILIGLNSYDNAKTIARMIIPEPKDPWESTPPSPESEAFIEELRNKFSNPT